MLNQINSQSTTAERSEIQQERDEISQEKDDAEMDQRAAEQQLHQPWEE